MTDTKPKVAVVLAPWSSGTSAVAGVIACLGADSHPPFMALTDPSTPRSFESHSLRDIIVDAFDHENLSRTPLPVEAVGRLRDWAGDAPLSVAKMPMLCFFLEEVCAAWDPLFVVVQRDPVAIEATRLRRGWPAEYGARGAERIYPLIDAGLQAGAARLDVDYAALIADPAAQGARIASFCGLPENESAVRYVLTRGREGQPPSVAPSEPSSG